MYIIALGDFVPTTISEGQLGLYQDDFKLVVEPGWVVVTEGRVAPQSTHLKADRVKKGW